MKKIIILLSSILLIASSVKSQSLDQKVIGKWLTSDKESILNFQNVGNSLCATLFWFKGSTDKDGKPLLDIKNPDKKLKQRSLIGIVLIYNLKEEEGKLKGNYYDVESGETYPCKIVIKDKIMELKVCDSSGWICETEKLTREK
jgi:uncharacterized protein (DUF2147 family)